VLLEPLDARSKGILELRRERLLKC